MKRIILRENDLRFRSLPYIPESESLKDIKCFCVKNKKRTFAPDKKRKIYRVKTNK